MSMAAANLHGTAVVLGTQGVLILGASGSGKTTLGLELIARAQTFGVFARLIGDDQLFPRAAGSRLVVASANAISGLIEVHGLAPVPIFHEDQAQMDLVVRIIPTASALRFQEVRHEEVAGVAIPIISVEERHSAQSASVVFAHLGLGPFAGMRQKA